MKSKCTSWLLGLTYSLSALLVLSGLVFAPRFAAAQSMASQAAPKPTSQSAAAPAGSQKTFASCQLAAQALYEAASKGDENAVISVLGPNSRDLVMWTTNADDRKADLDNFAKKYEQMHRFVKEPDHETTLYVGAENWPLPIPLVEQNGAWHFETALGRQEILFRRIGENEMKTIMALGQLVDAENEFYANDSNTAHAYCMHFTSDGSNHDGLYWEGGSESDESPVGPAVARASYDRSDRMPFHGYYFRILTARGSHAAGGAKNYITDGKLTAGFAFVAFPADYRSSGVKTFVVNENGVVYEDDLGAKTTQVASTMKSYDPGAGWMRVQEMSGH